MRGAAPVLEPSEVVFRVPDLLLPALLLLSEEVGPTVSPLEPDELDDEGVDADLRDFFPLPLPLPLEPEPFELVSLALVVPPMAPTLPPVAVFPSDKLNAV